MLSFFRTLGSVLSLAVLTLVVPAAAQDYPSRPVTIVVGYTPGATSDLVARTIGERLNAAWGQSVIVGQPLGRQRQHRRGIRGPRPARRLHADGRHRRDDDHQYLSLQERAVRSGKDFAPVIYAGANIICLAVNTEFPAQSVADVIAYARANPGKLHYGSSGAGSPHHLAGELLRQKTGIDIVHVPYRGGGATINDLLGGHIKVAFLSLSTAVPHLTTGKIKILAVVEKARYQAMPDVPTIGETVPGFEISSWHGIFAPAATPAPVIARLNAAIRDVLMTEGREGEAGVLGVAVATSTPNELADIVKTGLASRGELVKAANIQPE
jgi:tripartite-type tricarboxylate transporter receptor subunit TctC